MLRSSTWCFAGGSRICKRSVEPSAAKMKSKWQLPLRPSGWETNLEHLVRRKPCISPLTNRVRLQTCGAQCAWSLEIDCVPDRAHRRVRSSWEADRSAQTVRKLDCCSLIPEFHPSTGIASHHTSLTCTVPLDLNRTTSLRVLPSKWRRIAQICACIQLSRRSLRPCILHHEIHLTESVGCVCTGGLE